MIDLKNVDKNALSFLKATFEQAAQQINVEIERTKVENAESLQLSERQQSVRIAMHYLDVATDTGTPYSSALNAAYQQFGIEIADLKFLHTMHRRRMDSDTKARHKSNRDKRIWSLYLAGKSDTEIGQLVDMHPKSVSRRLKQLKKSI